MPSIARLVSRVLEPTSGYVGRDNLEFDNNQDAYDNNPVKLEMSNIRRESTLPTTVMYQIDMEQTVHADVVLTSPTILRTAPSNTSNIII